VREDDRHYPEQDMTTSIMNWCFSGHLGLMREALPALRSHLLHPRTIAASPNDAFWTVGTVVSVALALISA
jgi:hypothetical protein